MIVRKKESISRDFNTVYDENIEKIFRFAFLKTSSKDDAEDITSQAFIRFWKSYNKGKNSNSGLENPKAMLYTITRNLITDYYRKNRSPQKDGSNTKQQVSLDSVVVADKQIRADEEALLKGDIEQVMKALAKINDDYQNIIIWYYLDELSISEIANITNKTESTVRVLIHRALSALKKEL